MAEAGTRGRRERPPRVMLVASAGGHWVQLWRLRPAWDGCEITYVTTSEGYRAEVEADAATRGQPRPGFLTVAEGNRRNKLGLLRSALQVAGALLRVRPDVVLTTGAAPGYLALRLGRLVGARTAWIDSVANGAELSMSGARAGRHARLWLTQWPHLARPEGPDYRGAVL